MVYEPDIIITEDEPDTHWRVVLEVKATREFSDDGEAQLRRYMHGMRCPVGIFVTLRGMRVLVDDDFAGVGTGIAVVAEGPLPGAITSRLEEASNARHRHDWMEEVVQRWLEQLQRDPALLSEVEPKLAFALKTWLLPELHGTTVRAAHLRWTEGSPSISA